MPSRFRRAPGVKITFAPTGELQLWCPLPGRFVALNPSQLKLLQKFSNHSVEEVAAELGIDEAFLRQEITALVQAGVLEPADAEIHPARPESDAPIFVLGSMRSGTTLLRWVLDAHPRIHCPPETSICARLRTFAYEHAGPLAADLQMPRRKIQQQLRTFAEELLASKMREHGKQRWAEKSPKHALIADFIDQLFEGNCQFIIIVRHGLDVADSMTQMVRDGIWDHTLGGHVTSDQHRDDPALAAAELWAHVNRRLYEFKTKRATHCHTVRYEDLVGQPDVEIKRLFAFLGESIEPEFATRVFERDHEVGREDPKIRGRRHFDRAAVGRHRHWPKQLLATVAPLVDPVLALWSYPPVIESVNTMNAGR